MRNNFNNERQKTKTDKPRNNEIKIPLFLPTSTNNDIINEIVNVISETKFNKISIPVGTYRCLIDSNTNEEDVRICTIGYIRGYDIEAGEFSIIVFDKFIDAIKEMQGGISMDIMHTEYKGSLGTITKFNVIQTPVDKEEFEEADESNE